MTRKQYIDNLLSLYSLVAVLSDKNECKVLRIRNKTAQKDIVLRSFPKQYLAHEELYALQSENLPLIFDVINFSREKPTGTDAIIATTGTVTVTYIKWFRNQFIVTYGIIFISYIINRSGIHSGFYNVLYSFSTV